MEQFYIQSVTYIKLYTKIRIEIKHRILLIQFKTIPSLYELVNDIQLHKYAVHINRELDDKLHPQKCSVDATANAAER
jgi:hypothetical protein